MAMPLQTRFCTATRAAETRGHDHCLRTVLVRTKIPQYTRALVQLSLAAGFWSGAIYSDSSLRKGLGFRGEGTQNNTAVVVKSHYPNGLRHFTPPEVVQRFNRTIHLVCVGATGRVSLFNISMYFISDARGAA